MNVQPLREIKKKRKKKSHPMIPYFGGQTNVNPTSNRSQDLVLFVRLIPMPTINEFC
jgi:hypothetical protein